MNKNRSPFDHIKDRLPLPSSGEPAKTDERFTDEEMENIKREFAQRFQEIFPHTNNADKARRLNTQESTIGNYVKAQRLPTAEMLLYISRVTGANIHWLLTGEGSRRIEKKSMFSEEEEKRIQRMANDRGISFDEMVRRLSVAMIESIDKV